MSDVDRSTMMRLFIVSVGVLLMLILAWARPTKSTSPPPDIILARGRISTGVSERPWVEALSIRGDRIDGVGTSQEILAEAGATTRIIKLNGRLAIPGINDAHVHVEAWPEKTELVHKRFDPSWDEVLDSLKVAVAANVPGEWILGTIGPTVLDDPRAGRLDLHRIAPDRPVMLMGFTGHGMILNSAGLRWVRVPDEAPDVAGGWYERVPGSKEITGALQEYAEFAVRRRVTSGPSQAAASEEYRRFAESAVRYGITSIQQMALDRTAEAALPALEQASLPIRWRLIPLPMSSPAGIDTVEGMDLPKKPSPLIAVSGRKWILDGTPIERLGAQRVPYADRPDHTGRMNFTDDEVRSMLKRALARQTQPIFHVSGDRSAALVLGLMPELADAKTWQAVRLRFEHGDGIYPDLLKLAREMGVVLVQNPSHFRFPEIMLERFGEEGVQNLQPLRSALDAGIPLTFGSDGPLNPYLNMMFAVTHPTNPKEAITREEVLRAYTRGSAYAELAEREKGTLAPGMFAGIAVLSKDIFEIPVEDLPDTRSILTIVAGKIIYDVSVEGNSNPENGQR